MTGPIAPGQILLDKYEVERIIGQGGMGVVVAAMHLQLRRRVAIKFLLPEMLRNPEVVARFLREARAAAMLESHHVAKVIDVGALPDGVPFMVMEFLTGMDLASLVAQRGQVPVQEAVEHVLEACDAIAEAHRAGIVHRDLKPSNLFLATRGDGSTTVKVLDFGISKLLSATGSVALTSDAAVMGSPTYMAPEQIKSAKGVDARADIWGLGVVLYELLAGGVAFGGTEYHEVLAKVLLEAPPSLSQRRADIPPELETIVLRCLEKDPEKRFPTVAALALALGPFAAEQADRQTLERLHPPPEPVAGQAAVSSVGLDAPRPPAMSSTNVGVAASSPTVGFEPRAPRPRGILIVGSVTALALVVGVGAVWASWGSSSASAVGVASGTASAATGGAVPSETLVPPASQPDAGDRPPAAPDASSEKAEPAAAERRAAAPPVARTRDAKRPGGDPAPAPPDKKIPATTAEAAPVPPASTSKKSPLDVAIK
ncbi:MAG: protein kinase [Polyangiaceae bacterium]|nr:protein kinase [Polyangiaceae bacterium]